MFGRFRHTFTILLIIQVLIMIVGTLVITGIMKVNGYTVTSQGQWPLLVRALREWGFYGLLIPLGCVIWLVKSYEDEKSSGGRSLIGISLLTMVVLSIYGWGLAQASLFQRDSPLELLP